LGVLFCFLTLKVTIIVGNLAEEKAGGVRVGRGRGQEGSKAEREGGKKTRKPFTSHSRLRKLCVSILALILTW
jgi:hypothetical protein